MKSQNEALNEFITKANLLLQILKAKHAWYGSLKALCYAFKQDKSQGELKNNGPFSKGDRKWEDKNSGSRDDVQLPA